MGRAINDTAHTTKPVCICIECLCVCVSFSNFYSHSAGYGVSIPHVVHCLLTFFFGMKANSGHQS